mmetsp:Transcript_89355/g.238980  ORF Transcript_89355/g.238980 Transcript_89355/m.238980 type:complete len:233 (+) Transcript_89355:735-1433(+)
MVGCGRGVTMGMGDLDLMIRMIASVRARFHFLKDRTLSAIRTWSRPGVQRQALFRGLVSSTPGARSRKWASRRQARCLESSFLCCVFFLVTKYRMLQIRPFISQDLAGWRVRSLSFGNESFLIASDANKEPRRPWVEGCESVPHVISWGGGKCGELAYGTTKKSSANPDVVTPLTGLQVTAVAAGASHSVFLLAADQAVDALPTLEPSTAAAAKGKRPAAAAPPPAKKGKKK